MAWNGSGVFDRVHNWVADKLASIKIIASRMDAEFDNYKGGLENCLTRDGQTPPTADISWNSQKITGLANGTAANDAVNLTQLLNVSAGSAFRRNVLINGGFDVWQSGTSFTGTAARIRTADCWWAMRASSATGYTVSRQTGAQCAYACKWQRDNANASTAIMYLAQSLEYANISDLKLLPPYLTLSFYAKAGANYSGGQLTAEVIRGNTIDQNVLDGYTGQTVLATTSVTLSTTLTQFTLNAAADSSTLQLAVRFSWTPSGVAGADDSVTIERVQLETSEFGNVVTTFEVRPFGEILRLCKRYYEQSFQTNIAPAQNLGTTNVHVAQAGKAGATAQGLTAIRFEVEKRAGSTLVGTLYNPSAANAQVRDATAGADCSSSAIATSVHSANITTTGNASTAVGNTLQVHWSVGDPTY